MKLKSFLLVLSSSILLNACGEKEIVYIYMNPNGMPANQAQFQNSNYPIPQNDFAPQNNIAPNQGNLPKQTVNNKLAPNQQTSKNIANNQKTATTPKTSSKEDKILEKARTTFESVRTLQATVTTFEKDLVGKEGTGQVKFTYQSPGTVKIDVTNSPDSSQIGVKLSYSSSSVKVRPAGALSLVSVNLDMSDDKLLSGRKYKLNQIDLSNTVKRLTQPGTESKLIGQTQISGSSVILLEIKPKQHFDQQITREVLGLDSKTFLPRIHEMYQGSTKVYGVQVPSININMNLPATAFEV